MKPTTPHSLLGFMFALLAYPAVAKTPDSNEPGEFTALIEISADSFVKYELDEDSGRMRVDRFLSMPVIYPANYGIVPGSLANDGDPLDVMVYSRTPIMPGALITARAIGVLRMTDDGATDDKIIAVPASSVDPTYAAIRSIDDLPEIERQRLLLFYSTYKQLPEGSTAVELNGFNDLEAARSEIEAALQRAPAAK